MNYKELIDDLRQAADMYFISCPDNAEACVNAADAITALLARAEAAESAQETLQRAVAEYKDRAEKAEKKLEAAIGTIYALVADCPPEECREICANHDGACSKHAEMGHFEHCKGFKWIGEKEE